MMPPHAQRIPTARRLFGKFIHDDYAWMRQANTPAVMDYLAAENAYTDAQTAHLADLRATLATEMRARIQEDDSSVPYRLAGYYYYSRFETGQQYPILCRKPIDAAGNWQGAIEQILLDVNLLALDKPYMEVGEFEVSPDGQLLAFSTDARGFRQYKLQIKHLASGKLLKFKRERVTSVAWSADGQTLFYTTEDKQTKRSNQLWRHHLGEATDKLIHTEQDERFSVDIYQSRSGSYLFYELGSHTSSEVRFLAAGTPKGRWRILIKRKKGVRYSVDHRDQEFWIHRDDEGPNYRLLKTPIQAIAAEHWEEVIPHRDEVVLEGMDLFQHFLVCQERVQGLHQLRITDLRTQATHHIEFDEHCYSLNVEANAEFDSTMYRFGYESLSTPPSVYDYHMHSRDLQLRKQRTVLGDFDPSQYHSERLWISATDGMQIPVSLISRKGQAKPGPLLLQGYGAYGVANDAYFSSTRLSLLDRGITVAIAHIRGGGELGERWHDAGKMACKMNSFTDFICVAEGLIDRGLTSASQLAIEGGSAGGLLMGGVCNLRPDLFKVVLADVPFVDCLNTMLDASLPLTVGEYEEWGNPNKRREFAWIHAYSPYDNLHQQTYPAMLVKTALHDSQVMYWEAAKYMAKLRTLNLSTAPCLLQTNMGAGHSGASGRFERLEELAFDYAFLLDQLGKQ